MLPYIAMLGLSVFAGFIVQGPFPIGRDRRFRPRYRRGNDRALFLHWLCAGFLGTLLFGVTLVLFGGTSQLAAWALSFGTCGLDCLAGADRHHFPALEHLIWQR